MDMDTFFKTVMQVPEDAIPGLMAFFTGCGVLGQDILNGLCDLYTVSQKKFSELLDSMISACEDLDNVHRIKYVLCFFFRFLFCVSFFHFDFCLFLSFFFFFFF